MNRLSNAKLERMFAGQPDDMLRGLWDRIGTLPHYRVKNGRNKGQITMRWIRLSDDILAELKRRAAVGG